MLKYKGYNNLVLRIHDEDKINNYAEVNVWGFGTLRKVCDVRKLNNLGWKHNLSLDDGITQLDNW